MGGRHYQIASEAYDAAVRANLRKMEALTAWEEVRDHRIALPPNPVASLVMGISNDIGRTAEIRGRGEITPVDSRYGDDPIYAVFRFLDLDFIFQIVLSLFAILFAYDAINGEKERGTLRLTFANAVPRSTYILGKITGSYLGLAVPLLIPLLLGCLVLVLMDIPMSAGGMAAARSGGARRISLPGGFSGHHDLHLGADAAFLDVVSRLARGLDPRRHDHPAQRRAACRPGRGGPLDRSRSPPRNHATPPRSGQKTARRWRSSGPRSPRRLKR